MELKEANEKQNPRKFLTWITIFFAITLLFIAILSYYLVFLYPENQVSQLGITNITEKANFINQYRTTSIQLISTIAQIFGGIAVLIGIYFAWGNLKIAQSTLESNQKNAEKNLEVALANLKSDQETSQKNIEISFAALDSNIKNAQKSLEIAQEGQITERFTRAVDQLGNEKLEIRLGGIYALERIANESDKDYWPIMEILTAYIRKNSPYEKQNFKILIKGEKSPRYMDQFELAEYLIDTDKKLINDQDILEYNDNLSKYHSVDAKPDILAIASVIKRRNYFYTKDNDKELYPLDLIDCNLQGTEFNGANLQEAKFFKSSLLYADFNNSALTKAHFGSCKLIEASFNNATLNETDFNLANLKYTEFIKSKLQKAIFRGANLQGANLQEANLQEAYLERSNLQETNLQEANLQGTNLYEAYLYEANLKGAKNLTFDQLSKVKTLYNAKLDPELEEPLRKKYPALFEKPEE